MKTVFRKAMTARRAYADPAAVGEGEDLMLAGEGGARLMDAINAAEPHGDVTQAPAAAPAAGRPAWDFKAARAEAEQDPERWDGLS